MAAAQHEYLRAIGIEPLVLRAGVPATGDAGAAVAPDAGVRLRLQVRSADAEPLAGAHAALLRGVLRALDVAPAEVCFGAHASLPSLVFGDAGDAAGVFAPTLVQLRDARAKRRLWPALRHLRRQLRDVPP